MMKVHVTIALAATLALAPGWAGAWRAFNAHEVLPVSPGVFEVVSEVGSGAMDYWCSAGDYAYRGMGSASTQRVYIWRGLGPSVNRPGKKAIQFSLTPPAGADTEPALTLSMHDVGDNLRASTAQQFCFGMDRSDPFKRRL